MWWWKAIRIEIIARDLVCWGKFVGVGLVKIKYDIKDVVSLEIGSQSDSSSMFLYSS